MINIIKQELVMEKKLRKRLEFVYEFCNTKPTFVNGSIRKIDKSNLNYVKNIVVLAFNYSTDIFINNLSNKIKISELESYIKNIS